MWQPIETAPKDGTEILAWNGNNMTTVKWQTRGDYWSVLEPGSYCEEDDYWGATHWMSLPEPPK